MASSTNPSAPVGVASTSGLETSNEGAALWRGFLDSASKFPDHHALLVENTHITYAQLAEQAQRIAATIQAQVRGDAPPLTAVFAYRTATAFVGVLGSLLAGHGYVPLNRTFPVERTRAMLQRSGARTVVVDRSSMAQLASMLDAIPGALTVIQPDQANIAESRARWPQHRFYGSEELSPAKHWRAPDPDPTAIAYLLFTSGSTGVPKGVMVTHANVVPFIRYMVDRYQITARDRLSQMFEMTFDVSVFDMFVAWSAGACVCCPSQKTLIKPGKFIQDAELTLWYSVPSTAVFMKRLGMLKPGKYPKLRWSLFAGEPLPVGSATAWLEAAPNSILENLYGPTELTITCAFYRWDPARSPAESEVGVVPIGEPNPNMSVLVVDENLQEVPAGSVGELLMHGPQMTPGYWRDPDKTAAAFVVPPGRTEIFYRTGDRVRKPAGTGPMTHLGRVDFQVKVHGHRVELFEVEAVAREATGLDGAVAVGWPRNASGYGGIALFIEGEADEEKLRKALESRLPHYMVPGRIRWLPKLPVNANGKFDRKTLTAMLEEDQVS